VFVGAALHGGGGAVGPSAALPGAADGGTHFSPDAAQRRLPRGSYAIATARSRTIRVRVDGRARTIRARGGIPLTFLVKQRRESRLRVYLPTRPNRSTGWLRTRDVDLAVTRYRIEVRLDRHRLILWKGAHRVLATKIAKGRAVSPTPTGRYFVTDLLRPPDPHGFYGPYALGLSAHSPVYTSFDGGDGQIGLHGTDQPQVLGTDVSHGCIRVANRVVTRLAQQVPLGTPVDISHS
jgi:lipoprotein-anchoring transpeptidase ErfK/SrfK